MTSGQSARARLACVASHEVWALTAALSLAAAGCVDYDPAFGVAVDPAAGAANDSTALSNPCPDDSEVHILVQNFAFVPQCGCQETDGNVCTAEAGSTVVWTFADPEVHNVTSVPDRFGKSSDTLAGTFEVTLDEPGEYTYGCTIHAEMRGYSIVAQ